MDLLPLPDGERAANSASAAAAQSASVAKAVATSVATSVATALAEDSAREDITTRALVPPGALGVAEIRSKADGVVAGLAVAREVFRQVDAGVRFEALAQDGDVVAPGQVVARAEGSLLSLLEAERTAVNFLQRMSGIATLAAQFVAAVRGTRAQILATRKTAPGLRQFDLAAVRAGGAGVHRESLAAQVLVKENHLHAARVAGTAANMAQVVARVLAAADAAGAADPAARPKVGIEADDLDELRAALVPGVSVVLADNFTPAACAEAVRLRDAAFPGGGGPQIEASGGITLANVAAYAAAGVERISVGALTHSAPALDLSMKVTG